MVRRPYRIANSQKTKKQPRTRESLNDHNAEAHAEFKAKGKRANRRFSNKFLKTMTTAINDGRYKYYDPRFDGYIARDIEPVRRLYNSPDNHLFSIRDLLSDREDI